LPKLPAPTDRDGFVALQQKKPEVVKFMETVVKPTVAGILGLPEWSQQNPKVVSRLMWNLAMAPLPDAALGLCSTTRYAAASSSRAMTSTIFS
jgi:hypothetical protein